jgi:hypothetical protein
VLDMLIVRLPCFSLKVAEVSLSESDFLVLHALTAHNAQNIQRRNLLGLNKATSTLLQ